MDTSSFIFWWQIFKWFKVWKGQINCQLSAHCTMFENHPKSLIPSFVIHLNFRVKNTKINRFRCPFISTIFETFLVIFKHCASWTNIFNVKFEKLSRHCPGFLLLQWSIIAEIESVNWEGIRNFLASRVWKIAMKEEVLGKYQRKKRSGRRMLFCSD